MQKKRKGLEWKKLHNNGSTLITVLVAVCFLVILATMIISVSSVSLKMKQTEYVAKRNLYADELALSDVYNGIGKVTSDCLSTAYAEILSNVVDSSGEGIYATQDAAYKAFARLFMDKLLQYYPEGAYDTVTRDKLQEYITIQSNAEIVKYAQTVEVASNPPTDTTPYQYRFEGVVVKFRALDEAGNKTGYEAAITTDIVIEVPYINFFRDSSRIFDYALVGNKGIYFSNSSKNVWGNVYAGYDDSETASNQNTFCNIDVGGGLNFYQSNITLDSPYVVTKGDINIRDSVVNMGTVESQAYTQIWAESLRTVENQDRSQPVEKSEVDLKGNIYIANDLELNARESDMSLSGAYYGYNNGIYATQEKNELTSSYETTEHTQSSSMIINGTKSQLDLSGLTTMIIAGVAYVDLDSNAYSAAPLGYGGSPTGKIEEFATGESLALKTNQYMYLAPSGCLKTSNPVLTDAALPDAEVWVAGATWFGISQGYVNDVNPVVSKTIRNRGDGKNYTYYFLNFESGKRETYANVVLNMVKPDEDSGIDSMDSEIRTRYGYDLMDAMQWNEIWAVKEYLQDTAKMANSTVTIAPQSTATIYSRGALSEVTPTSLGSMLLDENKSLSLEQVSKVEKNVYKHYEWLYKALDPQEQFSLTSDSMPACTIVDAQAPISEYLDLTGLVHNGTGPVYKKSVGCNTYLRPISFELTDSNFKGIIICNGDVTIKGGASVEGLVIATGKIYIEGSGSIKANRSIVQQILDEEMTEEGKKAPGEPKDEKYACNYFIGYSPEHAGDNNHRVTGTDYTDYISYENWTKGEID